MRADDFMCSDDVINVNIVCANFPEHGPAARSGIVEEREPHPAREAVQVCGRIGGLTAQHKQATRNVSL